jgi:hypothetical protein
MTATAIRLDRLTPAGRIRGLRPGAPYLDAGAAGELPDGGGVALHHVRDVVEGHVEHVVQDERDPLRRAQPVEYDQHRQPDRVGQLGLLLRDPVLVGRAEPVGGEALQRLLAPGLPGAQQVEADAADHGRQPGRQVLHL